MVRRTKRLRKASWCFFGLPAGLAAAGFLVLTEIPFLRLQPAFPALPESVRLR
jgi:hypothetical protein